jgi:hypothetical protein
LASIVIHQPINALNKNNQDSLVKVIMIVSILMYAQMENVSDTGAYSMDKCQVTHWLVKEDSMIELFKIKRVLYLNTYVLVHLNFRIKILINKESMIMNVNRLLINVTISQHPLLLKSLI